MYDWRYKDYSDLDVNYGWPGMENEVIVERVKWSYGDTISFNISELLNTIDLQDDGSRIIDVTFYNFRYEPILNYQTEESTDIILDISAKESSEIFKKGLYYCQIKVLDNDTTTTILKGSNYCIEVM